jgi:glutathione synthase/RimK-type ligase-like ATP-grasp enzyme
MTFDCIVLTDSRYLKDSHDPYNHNVFYEDHLVVKTLQNQQLRVDRKAWDDPRFNWSETQCVLFRSTWDYFDRFDEFSKWLKSVSNQTTLINSKALIYWNLDKHYLRDLQKAGIPIPETHFIEKGSHQRLKDIHQELGWTETVLKPCVSGAGRHTYRLDSDCLDRHEALFKDLISKEAMMLQTFQQHIVSQGEMSLMLFNGRYTHAVLKKAKPGDFRVQDDFGGTVHHYQPSREEITLAQDAVAACPELPVYARVDMFVDNLSQLAISELELIEPELWFRRHPEAAEILANAIHKKLSTLNS